MNRYLTFRNVIQKHINLIQWTLMNKESTYRFYLHKSMNYFPVNSGFQSIFSIFVLKL